MATFLNIKNVEPADKTLFVQLKAKHGFKNAKELFTALLKKFTDSPIELPSGVDQKEYDALLSEHKKLEDRFNKDAANFNFEIDKLTVQNQILQSQIQTLTQKANQPQITGAQFIVDPNPELVKQMHRTILYLIKQKKFTRTDKDLPNQLAIKALVYLIKNEYSHIL